jgi:Fic family protein
MDPDFPWSSTHPFIDFEYDQAHLGQRAWLQLGQSLSRCQQVARSPLKPAFAIELADVYLASGAQSTTAIEGNTLSDAEALSVVREGTAKVPESREYLEREVANIVELVREIDACLVAGASLPITTDRLRYLNARVLNGIPDEPHVLPGVYRTYNVKAGRYRALDHQDVAEGVDQLVKWLEELRGRVNEFGKPEDRFVTAVLAATLAHLYIAWVHPFGNGNGRVARLIEVQILSESRVIPLVSTNLLSDHYNRTRDAYYRALDAAQRDVNAFVSYAVGGFVGELQDQIDKVRGESLQVHWESYVHQTFSSQPNTETGKRQRQLALHLPEDRSVVPNDVRVLTPELARLYALAGERMPTRDLNTLVTLGLATKDGRRYQAARASMERFMPPVAP